VPRDGGLPSAFAFDVTMGRETNRRPARDKGQS
jgi:hypothetical protein